MLCNDLHRTRREDLLFGFEVAGGEELFGVWVIEPSLENFVLDTGGLCQPGFRHRFCHESHWGLIGRWSRDGPVANSTETAFMITIMRMKIIAIINRL